MSEWVKLKNGRPMPPHGERVLIFTGAAKVPTIFSAFREKGSDGSSSFWYEDDDDDSMTISAVTHWMPLPAPPAKEKRDE